MDRTTTRLTDHLSVVCTNPVTVQLVPRSTQMKTNHSPQLTSLRRRPSIAIVPSSWAALTATAPSSQRPHLPHSDRTFLTATAPSSQRPHLPHSDRTFLTATAPSSQRPHLPHSDRTFLTTGPLLQHSRFFTPTPTMSVASGKTLSPLSRHLRPVPPATGLVILYQRQQQHPPNPLSLVLPYLHHRSHRRHP